MKGAHNISHHSFTLGSSDIGKVIFGQYPD